MFLTEIFRKYKQREYRLVLIRDLIGDLDVDDKQKNLYLSSLEVLDDEALERFYNKLTSVIEILEESKEREKEKHQHEAFEERRERMYGIAYEEQRKREQEMNSFNLILDNF